MDPLNPWSPAIAGPSKTQPAIAGVLVVDFGWYHYSRYHYSMDFYPLMTLNPWQPKILTRCPSTLVIRNKKGRVSPSPTSFDDTPTPPPSRGGSFLASGWIVKYRSLESSSRKEKILLSTRHRGENSLNICVTVKSSSKLSIFYRVLTV